MISFTPLFRMGLGLLVLIVLSFFATNRAEDATYSWTALQPENDSRDDDERSYDEFISNQLVVAMNQNEPLFHHRLSFAKASIKDLLSISAPFAELRFDAIKPLVLTDREKVILREYLARGGFVLLVEDTYPYPQNQLWSVKSWPVINFFMKELPATDPAFKMEKASDTHPVFHQYYQTRTIPPIQHEMEGNPNSPSHLLLTYRTHPSAFVVGRYYLISGNKWIAQPRPYTHVFSLDPKSYLFDVNIYIYATMH